MPEPISIGSILASGAVGLGNTLLSGLIGRSNMSKQVEHSKELMDYQWDKFQSPQAQVSALAQAGLNPLVAFGKGGSQLATPTPSSVSTPSYAPVDLSLGLGVLGNYIKSMADAKKAGVEVPNIKQDTRMKQIEADAKQYDFELQKFFAVPERAANLTLAWKNVMLKNDEHNINQWIQAKEKAMSEAKENERDILKKELDNMDTKLGLQNELLRQQGKTEQAKQGELSASAESHRTQSDVNRENRRLQAALADIEESSKTDKISSLISRYHADGALSDADYSEAMLKLGRLSGIEDKRSTPFFREVDNFTDWLKSKISIFK